MAGIMLTVGRVAGAAGILVTLAAGVTRLSGGYEFQGIPGTVYLIPGILR